MMRYLTVLAVLTTGCVKHIESYAPRTRDWSKIETKRPRRRPRFQAVTGQPLR